MYCKKCGSQIDHDAVFCSKCGVKQSHLASNEDKTVEHDKNNDPVAGEKQRKKRKIAILCIIFSLVILSGVVTVLALNNTTAGATSAKNFQYEYSDKHGGIVIKKYINSINVDITIPAEIENIPVVRIADNAFGGLGSIQSVTIPDSVTSIGEGAFSGCKSLTSINIPDHVTQVGGSAFQNCTALPSISLPDSVTSIGSYAFIGCESLTSIDIGRITKILTRTFSDCISLTSINIPDSVTSIGAEAFWGCISLTSIQIPDSVTSLLPDAFRNCSSLTEVSLPNSALTIRENVFNGCTSLMEIRIPDSATEIEARAFSGCNQAIKIIYKGNTYSLIHRSLPQEFYDALNAGGPSGYSNESFVETTCDRCGRTLDYGQTSCDCAWCDLCNAWVGPHGHGEGEGDEFEYSPEMFEGLLGDGRGPDEY